MLLNIPEYLVVPIITISQTRLNGSKSFIISSCLMMNTAKKVIFLVFSNINDDNFQLRIYVPTSLPDDAIASTEQNRADEDPYKRE